MKGTITADVSLVSPCLARRVAATFGQTLEAIVSSSANTKISELAVLSSGDEARLQAMNSHALISERKSAYALFEAQVTSIGCSVAVSAWDVTLTYDKLNRYASCLAAKLTATGVSPGSLVPLCFEKSGWMAVAILAVIRTGAAFVPLDLLSPNIRNKVLLDTCKGTVIVCSRIQAVALRNYNQPHLITLDQQAIEGMSGTPDCALCTEPDMLAYVYFTSGSTGEPKGVMISHATLSTSLLAQGIAFDFDTGTRMLQFSAHVWDASLFEVLVTLVHGGCVCIPSEQQRLSDLTGFMEQAGVNFAVFTPTVAASVDPKDVPALRKLLLSGEAVNQAVLSRWKDSVQISIAYGAVECGMLNCMHRLSSTNIGSNCIGRPFASHCWVVNCDNPQRLSPLGAVGELMIEGPLVGEGYLNAPAKTAEAFVSGMAWSQQSRERSRLYRTGDLVRYGEDGLLYFYRRRDRQRKIHGQRLQLGEIENILASHQSIRHVAVELPDSGKFRDQLVALFVLYDTISTATQSPEVQILPVEGCSEQIAGLKRLVSERGPLHGIPNVWMPLQSIPLNASGKLDRRQLQQFLGTTDLDATSLMAPNTKSGDDMIPFSTQERLLRTLWSEVLGLETASIGRSSSFYSVGGDSLKAMSLAWKARTDRWVLPVTDILTKPVLADMATCLTALGSETEPSSAPFDACPQGSDLEKLLPEVARACGVEADQIEDLYQATAFQEGMMAMTERHSGQYVAQGSIALDNGTDVPRLEAAWSSVVEANPIMRTRLIPMPEVGTLQAVLRNEFHWTHHKDVKDIGQELERARADCGFGRPMTRFVLTESKLCIFMHHAVYDGFCLPSILNSVARVYHGQRLEPRPAFRDYMKYLRDCDRESARRYWQQHLAGCSAQALLGASKEAQSSSPNGFIERTVCIPQDHPSDITAATVLTAATALTIGDFAGSREDVVIGGVFSNRETAITGIDAMIGPTATIAPLRIRLSSCESVADYLSKVQSGRLEIAKAAPLGLQGIRELSEDCRHACDFQVLLVVYPGETSTDETSASLLEQMSLGQDMYTHPLTIQMVTTEQGALCRLWYKEDVLREDGVRDMMECIESLCRALCADNAERAVVEVLNSCFDAQSTTSVLGLPAQSTKQCVQDLFAEQVLRSPHNIAVDAWDGSIAYEELDELSTRLAFYLAVHHTVGMGVPVAFSLEKSKLAVVAILGIFKAGGICVPLDVNSPPLHNAELLQTADIRIVLASPSQADGLRAFADCVVVLGPEMLSSLQEEVGAERAATAPDSACAMIFTSGSTGTRKGVVWEHQCLASSIAHHGRRLGFGKDSRVLQFASYVWDISMMEMLTTLAFGGCICVPSESQRLEELNSFIKGYGVNWAFFTPTFARTLNPAELTSLRSVVLGGEAVSANDIATWSPYVEQLLVLYGPCEACICATVGTLKGVQCGDGSIGTSIGSAVCWVTDPENPNIRLPRGAVGEILIEGPNLAKGYVNDAQRTNEAFITALDWDRGDKERRFYRTGDLGRMNRDGTFTFVGRRDDQVKVKGGQRLQLGEIERCLTQLPEVHSALAALPQSGHFADQLLAVIVFSDDVPPSNGFTSLKLRQDSRPDDTLTRISSVEDALRRRLPSYAVPVCFAVEQLPMSPSGKLDRAKVRTWLGQEGARLRDAISRPAPGTQVVVLSPTEQQLRQLWSDVLYVPVESIGPESSFFRLGGDSIGAIQVVATARKHGLITSVRNIIQSGSLRAVASQAMSAGITPPAVDQGLDEPFGLSPVQNLHMRRIGVAEERFQQSCLLEVRRFISLKLLEDAIAALCKRHPMLRAVFEQDQDGNWQQRTPPHVNVRVSFHKIESLVEARPLVEDVQSRINLRQGPMFAAALLQDPRRRQTLFLAAHHMIVDIVSWSILTRDLGEYLEDRKISSPEPMHFGKWCRMQAGHIRSQGMLRSGPSPDEVCVDLEYWGMSNAINIEKDSVIHRFNVNHENTDALLGSANGELRTTPLDLLLAAILGSFGDTFADRRLPSLFVEGHGREPWDNELDISRTVGWFTIFSPLLLLTKDWSSMRDVVRRVKDVRKAQPDNGFSAFAAGQLLGNGDRALPMEVTFNYTSTSLQLERQQSLFRRLSSSPFVIQDRSPTFPRLALLEVECIVQDRELQFAFVTNKHMKHQDKIAEWIRRCEEGLAELASTLSAQPLCFTLSDFPRLNCSYSELDTLQANVLPALGLEDADEVDDIYPATPIQAGILLAQKKVPSSYRIASIVRIATRAPTQEVVLDELAFAWQQCVDRHDVLRTVFISAFSEGGAFQSLVLARHDASASLTTTAGEDDASCIAILQESSDAALADESPQHHLTLCRSGSGAVYCKLDINHSLVDATSLSLVWTDLCLAYDQQLSHGKAPSYSRLVDCLSRESREATIDYWRRHLGDFQPCSFPELQGEPGARGASTINVPVADAHALRAFCSAHETTPATLLHLVWALVLRAYTGNDSVCFGYLGSGREIDVDDVDNIAGPFITMLVSRVNFQPESAVGELLRGIQNAYTDSLSHRSCSLVEIFRSIGQEPDAAFNTVFSHRTSWGTNATANTGLSVEHVDAKDPTEVCFHHRACNGHSDPRS